MKCTNCGKELPDGVIRCDVCGTFMNVSTDVSNNNQVDYSYSDTSFDVDTASKYKKYTVIGIGVICVLIIAIVLIFLLF